MVGILLYRATNINDRHQRNLTESVKPAAGFHPWCGIRRIFGIFLRIWEISYLNAKIPVFCGRKLP